MLLLILWSALSMLSVQDSKYFRVNGTTKVEDKKTKVENERTKSVLQMGRNAHELKNTARIFI